MKENSGCYYDPKGLNCDQGEDGKIKERISTNVTILSVLKNFYIILSNDILRGYPTLENGVSYC